MRNLKRVLSLALALVMVLGMMVITTSAADFTDADEITYTEAVDVISAIGVINGYPDGTFLPEGTLTREQGAALICYLLMGKDKADKLVGSGLFTDVAADRWSAGEIEYCVNLGYIAGRGDGTFDPEGPLTGIAYGKLLLCALGYDAKVEGYEGENWAAAILSDMVDIGLDVKDVDMGVQLTREQAAQMTLKALQSTMVKYSTKGTTITVGGVEIVNGASEATAVTTDEDTKTIKNDGKVQFAEKYFTKLSKETTGAYSLDVFGRPGYTWVIEADKDIEIFVADKPAFTFTSKVMNIAKTLKGYTASAVRWVDGHIEVVASEVEGEYEIDYITDIADVPTGNGVLVEVYANDEDVITDIVVINEYIGEITKVTPADEDEDTKRTVTVGALEPYETEEFSKKDTVLYTKAGDEIQSMVLAETVEGEVTAKSSKYVKIDGETYKANATYADWADDLAVGNDAALYLDSYGNLLALGKTTKTVAAVDDYVLVIGGAIDDWGNEVVKVLHTDGSVEVLDLSSTDTNAFIGEDDKFDSEKIGLYTYKVVKGAYKFTANVTKADNDGEYAGYDIYVDSAEYSKKSGTLNGWAIADDAVFFVYNSGDEEYVVVSGEELKSASSVTATDVYANKASTGFYGVEFGYVESALTSTTGTKYGYVVADIEEVKNAKNTTVDSVTFWNGTENVTIEAADAETNLKKGDLFSYTLTDGVMTGVQKIETEPNVVTAYDGTNIAFRMGTVYEITDDTVIMYINSDDVEGYEDGEIVLSEKDAEDNLIGNVIVDANEDDEIIYIIVDVNNEMLVNVEE